MTQPNYQYPAWTQMGKIEREIQRQFEADRQDRENRERRHAEAEERLDAPLTRREMLTAIENVRMQFAGSGTYERDLVADMFQRLIEELK